jgi:hypothetical protein
VKAKALALALLLGSLACTDPTGPDGSESQMLRTDGSVYHMSSGGGRWLYVEIPFTYTNGTGAPVYLPCGSVEYSLERLMGGKWTHIWAGARPLSCTIRPLKIEPGARYTGMHAISAGVSGGDETPLSGIDGMYRFRWHNLSSHDSTLLKPGSEIRTVSNLFTLVAPSAP